MNKAQKIVVYGFLSIVICFSIYFVFNAVIFGYHIDLKNYKPYMWVFKDSVKKDIDTNLFVSCIRKNDVLSLYNYKNVYYFNIWDFKKLKDISLKKVSINRNINLDTLKFGSGQILNKNSNPEINVRFGSFFKNSINVNIDNLSEVVKTFETSNYKGFYGKVNKLSLSDDDGIHHVIIQYNQSETPFELLIYKGHNGLYLITIHSEKPFDERMMNLLDLK